MTLEQERHFREHGYLPLRRALEEAILRPVRAHVLDELKRQKIWAGGRTLSRRMQGVPAFQQIGMLGQSMRYPGLKEKLMSAPLVSAMRELAGARLVPEPEAQLLLSLPGQGAWTLAGLNWHRDIGHGKLGHLPGVQAFVLIADVAPGGGATLALAGSHRITRYRSLRPGGGREMHVDESKLPVVEMAGRAGDVYLMDLRLLHTPSLNATKDVRMMATIRYFVL